MANEKPTEPLADSAIRRLEQLKTKQPGVSDSEVIGQALRVYQKLADAGHFPPIPPHARLPD